MEMPLPSSSVSSRQWKMPPPSSMSPLLLITLVVATAFSLAVSGAKVPSNSECFSAYNSIGQDAM